MITHNSQPTFTHTYTQADTNTAAVTVHTADGLTSTATTTVRVGIRSVLEPA